MNNSVPITIFGDSVAAFGVIRALSPYRIPIYIISKTGKGLATKSRYVHDSLSLLPDDQYFVAKVNDWIKSKIDGKMVLMVTDDLYLDTLSKNYVALSRRLIPTFPDWGTVSMVREKRKTLSIAKTLGIDIPKTSYIHSITQMNNVIDKNEFEYPVLVRPEISNKYKTRGVLCYDKRDLFSCYKQFSGFHGRMLLQEMIPGGEENLINVSIISSNKLEPLAIFMNRKKRSDGQFGVGTLVNSIWEDEVFNSALKIIEAIGIWGYAEAEFKYDYRTSSLKLIEVNGRISMLNSHALRCGINLPYIMYKDALGSQYTKSCLISQYPKDILWWYFPLDLISILKHRSAFQPMKLLNSFKGKGYIVEPLNWKDPRPLLYSIIEIMNSSFKRMSCPDD